MDEKVETLGSQTETVEADVSPAQEQDAADTAAATAPRALDLNELQEFSEKKLKALARDLDLHLHPARSRHQHILDIVRAAILEWRNCYCGRISRPGERIVRDAALAQIEFPAGSRGCGRSAYTD